MRLLYGIAVFLPLLLTAPAQAEFYKYTDQNGNIRFTDDITRVPRNQRQQLKIYEESKSTAQASAPAESTEPSPPATAEATAPSAGDVDENQLRAMHETLERKKSALAEQYRALTEVRKDLENRRGEIRTREEAERYQQSVRRFNARNDAYQQKRKAFDEEVESYGRLNSRFAETNPPEKAMPSQTTP